MMKSFITVLAALALGAGASAQTLTGTVTCGGSPVEGVLVSDGVDIVPTDASGRYALSSDKRQGFVFVISPSGYTVPLRDGLQPDFYAPLTYPADVKEIHDFELVPQQQKTYSVVFATDIHIKNDPSLGDRERVAGSVIPLVRQLYDKYARKGPVISIQLGDLSHDKVWYAFDWNIAKSYDFIREQGYPGPLYSVMGNHDNDGGVAPGRPDVDRAAEHLYRATLGPTWYSFNIGGDHWIMMDDIIYRNDPDPAGTDKGIAGKRNYDIGFTPDQMEWLRKDLSFLPDGTTVRICAHASFLFEFPAGKGTQFTSNEQLDEVCAMLSRFGTVKAYTGHTHRFQFAQNPRYPMVRDVMVPAASGNVWGTGVSGLLGIDAGDAGVLAVQYGNGEPRFEFRSLRYGESWMRTYDMNVVVPFLKASAEYGQRIKKNPFWTDYRSEDYSNFVYANIWMWRPEYTVEMYEKGKKLDCRKVEQSDPLVMVVPQQTKSFYKQQKFAVCHHLFAARAATADAPVTVVLRDASGKVVHREKVLRPQPFDPSSL